MLALVATSATAALSITEFPIKDKNVRPHALTAGSDGALWFIQAGPNGSRIGRMTTAGVVTKFALPNGVNQPEDLTLGSDGNVWVVDSSHKDLVRVAPTGAMQQFSTGGAAPSRLISGPGGDLWFTVNGGPDRIGRMTTGGVYKGYSTGFSGSLNDLAAGPDGKLWFTEGGDIVGSMTVDGKVTEYKLATNTGADQITAGPDGNVWFTGTEGDGSINRIAPATGNVTRFVAGISQHGQAGGIVGARDGNLYFTEPNNGKIGTVTPAGAIVETSVPAAKSYPEGITVGPDGNVWFADDGNTAALGRVSVPAPPAPPAPGPGTAPAPGTTPAPGSSPSPARLVCAFARAWQELRRHSRQGRRPRPAAAHAFLQGGHGHQRHPLRLGHRHDQGHAQLHVSPPGWRHADRAHVGRSLNHEAVEEDGPRGRDARRPVPLVRAQRPYGIGLAQEGAPQADLAARQPRQVPLARREQRGDRARHGLGNDRHLSRHAHEGGAGRGRRAQRPYSSHGSRPAGHSYLAKRR